ncbi:MULTISPECIES: glycoside hydrolase family 2 TIM barrel-domain containing protein [unclassified Streptomyces]|uniref:glycoside hydrolase family 2 TIM barrel-domain containing protein n=1 Tax=unclassified Streptomyces TaxID=2593676 RepID=UPI0035DA797F
MPYLRSLRRLAALAVAVALSAPLAPAAADTPAAPPLTDVYSLLEDPEATGYGQEPPHADLTPYTTVTEAREAGGTSAFTMSLDGDWEIHMSDRPDEVPENFFAEGYDTGGEGWRSVSVPHTWQTDGLDHPVFRNIPTEMYPDNPPKVPHDVNPTGAYVRTFQLPDSWRERETFLRFEGVTSGYLTWVNGHYVGYDQGGYTPAEYDISRYLHAGRNTIAVQVHRWGSGSHLEDVDRWRFAGIFRSVGLYSTPATRISDITVRTDLDDAYRDAKLTADIDVTTSASRIGKATVTGTLYDQQGRAITRVSAEPDSPGGTTATATLQAEVTDPAKWSDEAPNLYTLVVRLADATGKIMHTTSQPVGFREIEVKDKKLLVNGKRILIKGVNRAETDPETGRYSTRGRTASDVSLMKRLNINAVRTSHYPSDPYLYERADREGLWIADEIDVETHHHDSCPDNCLADKPEWQKAFQDRAVAMYERDKNHPSVLMWDTGNEAGLGKAHYTMADFLKKNDPGRPLYHQSNTPDGDAPFADIWGPRYPSPASLEEEAKTTRKPIVMGEYAHAQGNSLGNFREFWDVMRKYPEAQGGFIWDWAEQNITQPLIATPDSSGNGILAYLSGKPEHVDGHRGKALALSGLDDFVEVYRDPELDKVSRALTVDSWVKPDDWTGDFTIAAKGHHSYALRMRDKETLEFAVQGDDGRRHTASAKVPADWYGFWHRVAGTFDGKELKLLIDGEESAKTEWEGTVAYSAQPVNVGRNSETGQENISTRMAHGVIDQVRVYHKALAPSQLDADPAGEAVLALDFETLARKGEYASYGSGPGGVDGLVSTDRTLQPETRALAAVHAPLRISQTRDEDGGIVTDSVTVLNERSFLGTDDLTLRWTLTEGARTLARGTRPLSLEPGQEAAIRLPRAPGNPKDADRQLTVRAVQTKKTSSVPAGHTVAVEQFDVGGRQLAGVVRAEKPGKVRAGASGDRLTASGDGFSYTFARRSGDLLSMKSDGRDLLSRGPELDAWRAPLSNEYNSEDRPWREAGFDRLRTEPGKVDVAEKDGAVVLTVDSTVAAPGVKDSSFVQRLRYTVTGSGELTIDHRVEARGRARTVPYLPRIGLSLQVPDRYDRFSWYGRGPEENYNDREDGAPAGVYSTDVGKQFSGYTRPQDYGNHEEVRWASLTDGSGGLLVSGDSSMFSAGVTPYPDIDRAAYPFALQRAAKGNTLHLDHAVSGVSETFHTVLPEYQVRPAQEYVHRLRLRPLTRTEARDGTPRGPVVCAPEAKLAATDTSVAPEETTEATLKVRNPCDRPLKDAVVNVDPVTGWSADPATSRIGDLPADGEKTMGIELTRGKESPNGRHRTVATVTATSTGGARADGRAVLELLGTPPAPTGTTQLSALELITADNGWGPVERNLSNGEAGTGDGGPLTIGGVIYPKGLGVHADSTVEAYLGGKCTRFTADVGLDDETGTSGSVLFQVLADGKTLYTSPKITNDLDAVAVDADVSGAERLTLRVTDAGDGNSLDHADWAEATVHCRT